MRIVTLILVPMLVATGCDRGSDATPTPEPTPSAAEKSDTKSSTPAPSKHEDAAFVVSLSPGSNHSVGKESKVEAVLEARDPYKCNAEYPYKFKLDPPPEGVTFPADIARNIEKGEKKSVLSIPFTASTKGKKTIGGTFFFSVCNADHCKIDKRPMSITVDAS
jgi:hypothetical protein